MKNLVLVACLAIVFSSFNEDDKGAIPLISPNVVHTTATFKDSIIYGSMTDQDGNIYKTVTIGKQTWMAENLRTTKYNDGTAIPNVTDKHKWPDLKIGAYCNYNNTINTDTISTYGRLYNWYVVGTGKLAPNGWHVSTDAEWETLIKFLGGRFAAGSSLREYGTAHWKNMAVYTNNRTGFTAYPGGEINFQGRFEGLGLNGFWWSATDDDFYNAHFIVMGCNNNDVNIGIEFTFAGLSVRCVKD